MLPELHETLSMFGLPKKLKSDNGAPFNGIEFEKFCGYYAIQHRKITPYWPEANAEDERFMKNLTKVFQNTAAGNIDWRFELHCFLAAYRLTPHSTTKVAPAELLFKSNSTSRLEQMSNQRKF